MWEGFTRGDEFHLRACLCIQVEIVFLALEKEISEFSTYDGHRIQEVTIQRKHSLSTVTPFFDKVIHNLATMKRNKSPNQYSVKVICAGDALWQNVITFPEI